MKQFKFQIAVLAFLSASFGTFAQQIKTSRSAKGESMPYWVDFRSPISPSQLHSIIADELNRSEAFGFRPTGRKLIDKLGISHERYAQTYNNIDIYGSAISVHGSGESISHINGSLAEGGANTNISFISFEQALDAATRHVGAEQYMWQLPEMEAFIKKEQKDNDATFRPTEELVYFPLNFPSLKGDLRLAYKLDIYARNPGSRQDVLVDAQNGNILWTNERLHEIDEPGTAQTAFSGTQNIITYRPNTNSDYELKDMSRGSGVVTYDCLDTDSYNSAVVPTSTGNNWNLGNTVANSILDAHWGTEMTYDYFALEHNWSSFDNAGSQLLSYVHFNLIDFGYSSNNNAFWDGSRMTYGDGDGVTFHPFTCLDIAGHEITHGVTEFSANLIYSYESGALNESFSDIFGACIEYYANPTNFSWLNANDISLTGSAIRSMSDPNALGDPDTYQGDFWHTGSSDNGGVHTNSGVQNFWFYLLTEGGSGTNDNGDNYSVQGIGINEAEDIAFRNLSVYLNASSDYDDARTYSIQSALDLFGDCSDQVIAVTNAWHAVGVGPAYNNAVVAGFQVDANYSCVAPATIQFTNTSTNGVSYVWDFGDGNTSTALSPSHTYTSTGSYTVSLITIGTTTCNTSDTIVLAQPIVVESSGAPMAPTCQPSPLNPSSSGGVVHFSFNGIENSSSGASAGYQDFSCDFTSTVTEGLMYPMEITLPDDGYVGVWIDLNNDGSFLNPELVFSSSGNGLFHSANVLIPASSVFGTSLRVRVVGDTQPITSACSVSNSGQVEDYSVSILANTDPPVADFTSNTIQALPGEVITMQDLSLNLPTSWQWTFQMADNPTSTAQNPQVSFSVTGTYDVTLIATNTYGSDTLVVPDYFNIVSTFNLCDVSTTNAASGTFYDTGGPNGSYLNGENCELLIAPPCAQSVTLSFNSFQLESCCDYFRVYDGIDNNAPLLGTYNGSSIPSAITSSGEALFIHWTTDGSVTYAGFEAQWTAVIGSQDPLTTLSSVDDNNPAFGQEVYFSDLSVESPYDWHWDFGDGNTSTEQNPSHSYLSSGLKTVELTATNCVSSDTDTLYVDVQQPGGFIVEPSTLNVDFPNCEDSITTTVWVFNNGSGDLVIDQGEGILYDDFEGGSPNPNIWETVTGQISDACGTNSGNGALYFDVSGAREAVTLPLTLPEGGEFGFHLKYGNSSYPCDEIDGSEYARVIYSTDGGNNFDIVEYLTVENDFDNFNQVSWPVPIDAVEIPTIYQIYQLYADASGDNWAIDDFFIGAGNPLVNLIPDSVTVLPGDSVQLQITVYRQNLTEGSYQTELSINTNDPTAPEVVLPISYTIQGEGLLSFSEPCVVFDTIQEFGSVLDSIFLYNYGCADIVLDSLIPSNSDFQYYASSMTIAPNDSLKIDLSFNPSAYGNYNDSLAIYFDSGSDTALCLSGVAIGAPIVSSDPTVLDLQLPNCEDSISGSFWLYNTGNGDLIWQGSTQLIDDFEGGTYNSNIWSSITGTISNGCGTNSGNGAMYYDTTGIREAVTHPFVLSADSEFGFYLKYGNSTYPCDEIDGSEYARVQYSINGGNNFYTVENLTVENDFDNFNLVTFSPPQNAIGVPTIYKITQLGADGTGDNWAFDDFFIGNSGPGSLNLVPESGITGVMDSVLVNYTFYRDNLTEGSYQDTLWITSNDPVNAQYPIPMNITVNGLGELTMEPGCLNFPEIQEYVTITDSVLLINTGCAALTLSNFSTTSPEFVVSQGAFVLQPNDTAYVQVTYAPTLFGTHTADLTFQDDSLAYQKCLAGSADGSALISVVPSSLNLTGGNCPDSLTTTITIHNNGNAPLDWTGSSFNSLSDDFENATLNSNLWEYSTGTNSTTGCGAYQGLGEHYFSFGEPRYITTVPLSMAAGTVVEFYLFYGNSGSNCETVDGGEYVTVEYSTNGFNWVTFATLSNLSDYYNWALVSATLPANGASSQTQIRIIQNNNSGTNTDEWAIDNFSVGIQSTGTFSFLPESGTVPIDDSTEVSILLDVSDVDAGVYQDSILIISNDPTTPNYWIPVEYTIEGTAQLSYPGGANCVDMGSIFVNTVTIDSVYIENSGCSPLNVTTASISSPHFTVSQTPGQLLTGEGGWVHVQFNPTAVGAFTETLEVTSTGGDVSICIEGEGLAAPEINTIPGSLQVNFDGCSDTVIVILTLENLGGSILDYSIVDLTGNSEVTIDTVLSRWNSSYASVTSLVPNMFEFTEGTTGYYISDGGSDMYDTGNRLQTDQGSNINYSNNTVLTDFRFGPTGQYFTSKVDGMFIMVADIDNLDFFQVQGYTGQGNTGSQDTTTLAYTVDNTSFTGYVRRVFGATNPSINHIFITETNPLITHWSDPYPDEEDHYINYINDNEKLYYLLFSSVNGGYIDNNTMQSIMEEFLDNLLQMQSPFLVNISPSGGTINPGSNGQVSLTFVNDNSEAGTYSSTVTISSNDPLNPEIEIPVVINVPDIPCCMFDFEYVNGCEGEVHFINETVNDPGAWLWDFGDGSTSTSQNPTHVYAESGYYTVTLTAGSGLISDTFTMEVYAQPISASFLSTDPNGNNGLVEFASTTSQATEWLWAFGDGGTSTEEHPTHTYSAPGTYVVTLYVWDANGCPGFISQTIEYGVDGILDQLFSDVVIHPNPTSGTFMITGVPSGKQLRVSLKDAIGQNVINSLTIANGRETFDITGLASGVYILELELEGVLRHQKLVKE